MKLKHKFIYLLFLISVDLFAIDVIIAKDTIKYKSKLESSKLSLTKRDKVKKDCIPFTLEMHHKDVYISKHFINKGMIICLKDVKKYRKESVVFQFGLLQIEKEGKVIFQNDKYISIKKSDGKVDKIYKDGRIK